ncbi:sensory box protein, partial [Vibrio parahaemolyticus V-223/04]
RQHHSLFSTNREREIR